jgi:hypothetical protein
MGCVFREGVYWCGPLPLLLRPAPFRQPPDSGTVLQHAAATPAAALTPQPRKTPHRCALNSFMISRNVS